MEPKSRKSLGKQMLRQISKHFKTRDRSQEQPQGSDSFVANLDRPSSAPRIPLELLEQAVPALSIQPLVEHHDSATDIPPTGQAASMTAPSAIPTISALTSPSTTGAAAVSSPSAQLSAWQITKFFVRAALGGLSNAAEGIPIPGVKGIFNMIIDVIDLVEVSQLTCLSIKHVDETSPGNRRQSTRIQRSSKPV
jgi:hypothetical protein